MVTQTKKHFEVRLEQVEYNKGDKLKLSNYETNLKQVEIQINQEFKQFIKENKQIIGMHIANLRERFNETVISDFYNETKSLIPKYF